MKKIWNNIIFSLIICLIAYLSLAFTYGSWSINDFNIVVRGFVSYFVILIIGLKYLS
jgi:hypothetical protein